MTYAARETSEAQGRPIELYRWARGAQVWRYTSADRDVTVEGDVYTARAISRGRIENGTEVQRTGLNVTVPHDLPVADLFSVSPPADPVTLTLLEYHEGDSDAEVVTKWQGEIGAVRWEGVQASIEHVALGGTLNALGLRRAYQRNCPHVLYGMGCELDAADFRVTGTVDSIDGLVVSVTEADALADGYFDGGWIEWEVATGIYDRRFIVSHAGADLTLDMLPIGLQENDAVRFYPGCDHTIETCESKFANNLNYGGMPYIPQKNMFGSDPIF